MELVTRITPQQLVDTYITSASYVGFDSPIKILCFMIIDQYIQTIEPHFEPHFTLSIHGGKLSFEIDPSGIA